MGPHDVILVILFRMMYLIMSRYSALRPIYGTDESIGGHEIRCLSSLESESVVEHSWISAFAYF